MIVAGAVYKPDELIEPVPVGLIDQITLGLEALLTVAVSCAVWPLVNIPNVGVTFTATGGAVPVSVII